MYNKISKTLKGMGYTDQDTLFFRIVQNPDQALTDLERGYSYHQTACNDLEEVEQLGIDIEKIEEINGCLCEQLDGLCGFDDLERALNFWQRDNFFGDYLAIFVGQFAGTVYDGDLFKPVKLITTINLVE